MSAFIEAQSPTASSAYHRNISEATAFCQEINGRNVAGAGTSLSADIASTQAAGIAFTIPEDDRIVRWSDYLESRFQNLVALRAERKASANDLAKLSSLRRHRQRLKNPLKGAQVLQDFKASELRQTALGAIQAYVQFLENPSGRSKTRL